MEGLYDKYKIEKTDGSQIDPYADYFILRLDADKHAQAAAITYAKSIIKENPKLAADLLRKISDWLYEDLET